MPTRAPKRRDDSNDPAIGCAPPPWTVFALVVEAMTLTIPAYVVLIEADDPKVIPAQRMTETLTAAPHGPTVAGAMLAA